MVLKLETFPFLIRDVLEEAFSQAESFAEILRFKLNFESMLLLS
mgnify:CR=1 FL=1